jgi:RNA polymerase sigma-70 factor (ECF subfamily)
MPTTPQEFDAIFAVHSAFAWRVLSRFGVPDRDLADVCQEVFVVVFKGLPTFEGRASLKTWIYGICRRLAANHRRRSAHVREIPSDPLPETASEVLDDEAFEVLAHKQSLALLDGLIARLPAAQREVFLLYEVEELTMREVATALDCSQNTAFARLYAARAALEAAVKQLRARRRVA